MPKEEAKYRKTKIKDKLCVRSLWFEEVLAGSLEEVGLVFFPRSSLNLLATAASLAVELFTSHGLVVLPFTVLCLQK